MPIKSKYYEYIGQAAITENTEPTGTCSHHGKYRANGDTQPARKKTEPAAKQQKWNCVSEQRKNSTQASARDTKILGISKISPIQLKIHLLYRTGAAVFMKIHAAASYFSFKIVIIISYMKCCFGAAKTDCTDIGFLK